MELSGPVLLHRLMMLIPLLLSLSVHEWAHAYSAWLLDDDTAARQGRLTLNPLAHLDPIGTLLCPMLGIPFGWAKPVPVNPLRFRRGVSMRLGMMFTAAAGPLSNLVLAVGCALIYGLLQRSGRLIDGGPAEYLLRIGMLMNVGLCVFNFVPIPPLDGSRIADGLMPYRLRPAWEQFAQYGMVMLGGFFLLNAYYFHGRLLATPIGYLIAPLNGLVRAVGGWGIGFSV